MEPMIASLLRPEAYDHQVDGPQLLETHISWVLLTGQYAYKLKKPVNFGFVDFSTPERRRWFCEEELRLNRRLAADLYLGLRPIHGPPERATFRGDGPVIDMAVQMRQFPQQALLAEALASGHVEARHWRDLADTLAAFQATAAVARSDTGDTDGYGSAATVRRAAQANLDALAQTAAARSRLPALQHWTDTTFATLAPVFDRRRQEGRVLEGHGDLHLGNMVLLDDRITVFDCLEFNPDLRWIDVMSELAFLVMDLAEHWRPTDGARLLNRWLDRSGDYTGLATWRWYVVYRALVRAKVTAMRLGQTGLAEDESAALQSAMKNYLRFAQTTIDAPPGTLTIAHGVSGSGKSHLSARLCDRLGWIHLRSDAERKRLFGRWGIGASHVGDAPPELYRPEVTDRLYGHALPEQAASALHAGFSLIVDATFLNASHRLTMAALARRCGARFRILDCRTDAGLARDRIARRHQRGDDPSDADATVLASQLTAAEPLSPDELAVTIAVDPASDTDTIAARLG